MCGIFGITSPLLPESKCIRNALDAIRHRGPDDEGYLFIHQNGSHEMASGTDTPAALKDRYQDITHIHKDNYHLVLGNRRLAIIDLSPQGHQPMSYEDGNLWITYNGEIFNYRELRSELKALGYRFHSDTDTEVLLAAYSEWGEECVDRFNGQWAFCIYDKKRNRLFCSRDRFGIKPFYYWFDGNHFAFASEMKALLMLPFVREELNMALISEFVMFSILDHSEETCYKGICHLPPAYNLVVDLQKLGISKNRYYELPCNHELGKYSHRQALQYADTIRDLLTDAVKMQLGSDVPIGSCLSGGLDSSSIVVIINKLLKEKGVAAERIGKKQKTFTASYDDPSVDEKIHADRLIRHVNVDGHFVFPSAEMLWKEFDTFLFHQEGLCFATNIYAGWDVMRLASGHVKVVLNGQGGDEIFGGYPPRYAPVYMADIIKRVRLKELIRLVIKMADMYGFRNAFSRFLMSGHLALSPDAVQVFLFEKRNRRILKILEKQLGCSVLSKKSTDRMVDRIKSMNYRLWCDLTADYLPQLLHYDDRNAAAFSIENRVPFLDHRLVEYVCAIPSIYKYYNGWTKWLLRLAMRDLLPEKILWRKDKVGFSTPEKSWVYHKDSPIPLFMEHICMKKYGHVIWRLYLADQLMRKVRLTPV